jgi:hypothetical protein
MPIDCCILGTRRCVTIECCHSRTRLLGETGTGILCKSEGGNTGRRWTGRLGLTNSGTLRSRNVFAVFRTPPVSNGFGCSPSSQPQARSDKSRAYSSIGDWVGLTYRFAIYFFSVVFVKVCSMFMLLTSREFNRVTSSRAQGYNTPGYRCEGVRPGTPAPPKSLRTSS